MVGATLPNVIAGLSSHYRRRSIQNDGGVDDRDGLRAAQSELDEQAALVLRRMRREADGRQQLVRAHRRPAHALVELGKAQRAFAPAKRSVTVASSAHNGVIVSLAGLAVIRLPATVPRLRICGEPTSQHAGPGAAHAAPRHSADPTT